MRDVQIDVLAVEMSALNDTFEERLELSGLSHTFENVSLQQLTILHQIPVTLTNVSNIIDMKIFESTSL